MARIKGRGELGHTTVEEEDKKLVIFLNRIKDFGDQKEKEEERRRLKEIRGK